MGTIKLENVSVHDVPTTEGLLTAEVVNHLNKLSMLAGLYDLKEVSYNHLFLTGNPSFALDCEHCEGTKEIRIPQFESNEEVLIPCVCSEEYVTPMFSDLAGSPEPTSAPAPENGIVANVQNPVRDASASTELIATHTENQVALLKSLGYDFTEFNGQPARFYQFIVVGEQDTETVDAETVGTEINRLISAFDEGTNVYPLGLNFAIDAQAEFETPRIMSATEIAINRVYKDLRQVRDVDAVISVLEQDFANHHSIEAQDIALRPGDYNTTEFLLQIFVRTVLTMAVRQNARYVIANPDNGTRIENAYYRHTETGETYLVTQYFMDNSRVPTNYAIAKELPTDGEYLISTADFRQAVENSYQDIENLRNTQR